MKQQNWQQRIYYQCFTSALESELFAATAKKQERERR